MKFFKTLSLDEFGDMTLPEFGGLFVEGTRYAVSVPSGAVSESLDAFPLLVVVDSDYPSAGAAAEDIEGNLLPTDWRADSPLGAIVQVTISPEGTSFYLWGCE